MSGPTPIMTGDQMAVATNLFNSAISGFALAAAAELGVLDELEQNSRIDIAAYARDERLHEPSLRAIVDAMASAGIVEVTADRNAAKPTPAFTAVYDTKGFFVWLLSGCGELLRTAGTVARTAERTGAFVRRDARAIGRGAADFGARFIDPLFEAALGDLEGSFVADLGCGSGDRLIRAVLARPGARGLGIDISPAAVELARERVAAAGLEGLISIVQDDVRALEARPEFAEVDYATCFLMGHDFWPRERCLSVLESLRRCFPRLRSFALCDTYRSGVVPSDDVPFLTLGFEFVHALMGQYVPTLEEWRDVFAASGWRTVAEHDIPMPPFTKIFHLVPE